MVAESCDVYHGPDLDGYAKVGSVDAGEVVAVLEYETPISADKWLMIEYNTTSRAERGDMFPDITFPLLPFPA